MKQQLITLHQTLDSALSELRDLLAQDETIEAALTCELLASAVDQLLALEQLVAKPEELQAAPPELLDAIAPFTRLVESEVARLAREETNLHAITVCLVTQRYAQAGAHEKLEYATELGHVTLGDLLLLQALYRKTSARGVLAKAVPGISDALQRLANAIACISSRDYPHVVADAMLALRELESWAGRSDMGDSTAPLGYP